MRVLVLAATLLVLTATLAGCSGKGSGDDASSSSSSTSSRAGSATTSASSSATSTSATTTTTGSTTTAPNATNRAPTAQLSAVVANGSLTVNFTLDGADLDQDPLAWTLAFGDGNQTNGTTLPANVTHDYVVGNYTATLTVSDGKANGTASVNVTLASSESSGGQQMFNGEWSIGSVDVPLFLRDAGCEALAAVDGVFMAQFDVDAATLGKPYTVTFAAATTAASLLFVEISFLDAACAEIEGQYVEGVTTLTGVVPAGATSAYLTSDGGAMVEGAYTAG